MGQRMKTISVDLFGHRTGHQLDDDDPVGAALDSRLLREVRGGELYLITQDERWVTEFYIPEDGDELRVVLPKDLSIGATPALMVVANRFGEELAADEYARLRRVLADRGQSIRDLRVAEARAIGGAAPQGSGGSRGDGMGRSSLDLVLRRGVVDFAPGTWPYAGIKTGRIAPIGPPLVDALVYRLQGLGRESARKRAHVPASIGTARAGTWADKVRDFQKRRFVISEDPFVSSPLRQKELGLLVLPLWRFSKVAVVYHPGVRAAHQLENAEFLGVLNGLGVRVVAASGTAEKDVAAVEVPSAHRQTVEASIRETLEAHFAPYQHIDKGTVLVVDALSALDLIRAHTSREAWDPDNGDVQFSPDRGLIAVSRTLELEPQVTGRLEYCVKFIKIAPRTELDAGLPYIAGDSAWKRFLEQTLDAGGVPTALQAFRQSELFGLPFGLRLAS